MGVDKVNVALRAHADEAGPVDRWILVHWANHPSGELTEAHELSATEWVDMHDATEAANRTTFEDKLTTAWASPSGWTWASTTGGKVLDAAWEAAQLTWTP